MPCVIKALVKVPKGAGGFDEEYFRTDSGGSRVEMEIGGTDKDFGEVRMSDVVEAVAAMDPTARSRFADLLLSAREYTLTESDLKNLKLVSNVTLEEMLAVHNLRLSTYGLERDALNEDFTILDCSRVRIGGDDYSGLMELPDGRGGTRKVYIIRDREDANRFFWHLVARNSLRSAAENGGFPKEVVESLDADALRAVAETYHKGSDVTLVELLGDFIESSGKYGDVKVGGVTRNAARILDDAMRKVTGHYYMTNVSNLNDLEMAVWQKVSDKSDIRTWKVSRMDLYDIVSRYGRFGRIEDVISRRDFALADREEIDRLLFDPVKGLLRDCNRLREMRIASVTSPDVKEGEIEQVGERVHFVGEHVAGHWESVVKAAKRGSRKKFGDTYRRFTGNMDKLEELDTPEKRARFFNDNSRYEVQDEETGKYYRVEARVYDHPKGGKEKGTEKIVRYLYTTPKYRYRSDRIGYSEITFENAGYTMAEKLGMSYDKKYVTVPVHNVDAGDYGIITDGYYHGAYVYVGTDGENGTRYYVTRDIMSPYAKGRTYRTLEDALDGIDSMNAYDRISSRAVLTPKQTDGFLREVAIEASGLNDHQIISMLDIRLPNVRMGEMFKVYRDLFSRSVGWLHKELDAELGLEPLYTPEMCAAYLVEQYHDLYDIKGLERPDNLEDVLDQIRENHLSAREYWDGLVSSISNAGRRHYYVESLYADNRAAYNRAKLVYLVDDGVTVDVSGESVHGIPIARYITNTLNMAIDAVTERYADCVERVTTDELSDGRFKGLGFEGKEDQVRAFVHDGKIYINTSVADASDLYHEVTHLFLGVVKKNDYAAYEKLLDTYSGESSYRRFLSIVREKYEGLADMDAREEALARYVAERLSRNVDLIVSDRESVDDAGRVVSEVASGAGFDPEVFESTMRFVLDTLNAQVERFAASKKDGRGMDFTGWFGKEIRSGQVKNDRLITNFIKQLMITGEIDEKC